MISWYSNEKNRNKQIPMALQFKLMKSIEKFAFKTLNTDISEDGEPQFEIWAIQECTDYFVVYVALKALV